MNWSRSATVSSLVAIIGASASPAYAYLDAGTGSMILQLLLGGLAGLAVVGRLYWSNTKDFFRKLSGKGAARTGMGDDVTPR